MLYGFLGNICAGKSTSAKMAQELLGGHVVSFADSVRETVEVLEMPKVRKSYQLVGNKLRDVLGMNIWVNTLARKVAGFLAAAENVFIDDVRFQNEIKYVKDLGGKVIYLKANVEELYRRYEARGRNGDSLKFEEFTDMLQTHKTEIYSWNVSEHSKLIDFTIDTTKGYDHVKKELYGFITDNIHGQPRNKSNHPAIVI